MESVKEVLTNAWEIISTPRILIRLVLVVFWLLIWFGICVAFPGTGDDLFTGIVQPNMARILLAPLMGAVLLVLGFGIPGLFFWSGIVMIFGVKGRRSELD